MAADLVKERVYAVDSDAKWVEKVQKEIQQPEKKVELIHVDIGPTGNWGMPIDSSKAELFPNYSLSILDANVKEIDICLIDGRFRVACFLQALSALNASAVLAIHDYRDRPEYHIIEQFARPIAQCEQLYFFVRRPQLDMHALSAVLDSYRRNPT